MDPSSAPLFPPFYLHMPYCVICKSVLWFVSHMPLVNVHVLPLALNHSQQVLTGAPRATEQNWPPQPPRNDLAESCLRRRIGTPKTHPGRIDTWHRVLDVKVPPPAHETCWGDTTSNFTPMSRVAPQAPPRSDLPECCLLS